MCGTPIDLKQVTADIFSLAGTNDHITPWKSCYKSAQLFGGKVEFVLSSSGHIQSILNPPGNPKARYMTSTEMPVKAEEWMEKFHQAHRFLVVALAGVASRAFGQTEEIPRQPWQQGLSRG